MPVEIAPQAANLIRWKQRFNQTVSFWRYDFEKEKKGAQMKSYQRETYRFGSPSQTQPAAKIEYIFSQAGQIL
jgi:hypothetical protein